MTEPPTHIIREPGDKKALCGAKKPLPVVWLQAAPKHRYLHARCRACYELADLGWML